MGHVTRYKPARAPVWHQSCRQRWRSAECPAGLHSIKTAKMLCLTTTKTLVLSMYDMQTRLLCATQRPTYLPVCGRDSASASSKRTLSKSRTLPALCCCCAFAAYCASVCSWGAVCRWPARVAPAISIGVGPKSGPPKQCVGMTPLGRRLAGASLAAATPAAVAGMCKGA